MSWIREPGRPVIWTREGKLIYNDRKERDQVLRHLREQLRAIIKGPMIEGITIDELGRVCRLITNRENQLTR